MAHAEVQSLGVYKFVLNWLSIMWLKKVRYQPQTAAQVLTSVGRSWPSAVSHLIGQDCWDRQRSSACNETSTGSKTS